MAGPVITDYYGMLSNIGAAAGGAAQEAGKFGSELGNYLALRKNKNVYVENLLNDLRSDKRYADVAPDVESYISQNPTLTVPQIENIVFPYLQKFDTMKDNLSNARTSHGEQNAQFFSAVAPIIQNTTESPDDYSARVKAQIIAGEKAIEDARRERIAGGAMNIASTVTDAMKKQEQPTRLSYQQEAIRQAGGLQTQEGQPFSSVEKMGALTQAGKLGAVYPTEYQQQGRDIAKYRARLYGYKANKGQQDIKSKLIDDARDAKKQIDVLTAKYGSEMSYMSPEAKESAALSLEEWSGIFEALKGELKRQYNLDYDKYIQRVRDLDAEKTPPAAGPSRSGFDAWKAKQGK